MKKVRVPVHRTSPTQSVLIDPAATNGAQVGVNLLDPDGKLVPWPIVDPSIGGTSLNTTDDLDEGQWNLWFTDLRAQDAVGAILADSATISLAYVAGTSITAALNDLADSGTGAALVKITRDAKGRVSGTHAATTTDLTEGSNLYYTDARSDARISVQKAQPLGLATLDAGGKLDAGQLPALAITETFVVNTQAAMLALAAQEGDVAVRTDLSKSLILTAAPASTLANWQELLTPASPVTSVFGRTGSVTAASGDYTFAQIGSKPTTLAGYGITDAEPTITAGTTSQYWRGDKTWQTLNKAAVGLGNVDNTSDVNKPVSTAQAAADALNVPLDGSRAMTGSLATTGVFGSGGTAFAGDALFTGAQAGLWAQSSTAAARFACLSSASNVQFIGARCGGTLATPTATPTLVALLEFDASSYTGSGWVYPGTAAWVTTEAHSPTARGTRYEISTTPIGTTTLLKRLHIDRSGNGAVGPGADNTQDLGEASLRWAVVRAGTGSINTSDAREKTDVAPLTSAELATAAELARAIGTYQWLSAVQAKGADARWHAGLTVQQAIAIMQSHGLDPMRYGFICYDQWPETPEVVNSWPAQDAVLDDDGNAITPAVEAGSEITQQYRPAGDRYSFRHDELLLFIARGFAARLDALESA
jgi:hypothetical protein